LAKKLACFESSLSGIDENRNVVSYLILPIKVTNHVDLISLCGDESMPSRGECFQ
jgi:hypothetical protein